jgi:membrane protease YdiL (CAAX protease family)
MYPSTLATPTYLPFLLLLVAVLGLWIHRYVWAGGLLAAVITAYFTDGLYGYAFIWIALLGLAAVVYRLRITNPGFGLPPWAYCLAFGAVALWIGIAPPLGFPRTPFVDSVILSPGAAVWSLGLGFNKVITGIFILGILHQERVQSWRELAKVLKRIAPVFLVTLVAVMIFAMALGYVRFDPKWTPLFLVWAPVNLFFTCLAEEAFFRGFVQRELSAIGSNRKLASIIAVIVTALLFGLAHFGGGWKYALVAAMGGMGYGWAYHRTQRIEAAMAVHFALNATHFLLFTYPAILPESS